MSDDLTADPLLAEAREWHGYLIATDVAGHSILKQLIERLERAGTPPVEAHWLWVASLALSITAPDMYEDETEWRIEGHSGRSHSYRGGTLVEALKDFWESEIRSRDMEGNPTEPDRALPMQQPVETSAPHYACGTCGKKIETGCYCSDECANADE